jgi:hypothetical protein
MPEPSRKALSPAAQHNSTQRHKSVQRNSADTENIFRVAVTVVDAAQKEDIY